MVNKTYYHASGVPTAIDSENNRNPSNRAPTKYTVNNRSPSSSAGGGGCLISRPILCLIMTGILLLLLGAVVATYFLAAGGCTTSATRSSDDDAMMASPPSDRIAQMLDGDDRLPNSLRPEKYRITLMPFIWEGNFTTNGEVIITLNVTAETNKITLHINDIFVDEKSVQVYNHLDESAQVFSVTEHIYDVQKQQYTVILDDELKKGNLYDIRIKFVGHLNDLLQGFYRISYVDYKNKVIRWIAATQFSPTDARRAFPCMDEPALKACFTISLARWKNMTTRSNMNIKTQTTIDNMDDWIWDHYEETPVMSTYLVAMMVTDLQPFHVSTDASRLKSGNSSFSVWARREALEQTRYAGKIGPSILQYFERYFQIPFPLPKLDMVALPDFGFHAMENWGLITFRESSLLFDEKISTIESQRHITTVISHELGHQWFGNLVTPEWWDDLWLKEGFATYMEYLGTQYVQPLWNITDEFVMDGIQDSFDIDCLKSSHPIHVPVHQTEQIRQIFDPISYKKGASIIRMLNHVLGEYTFKVGLINYLNSKKYNNAYHDDLWDSLTKQAHNDGILDENLTLKQIMDSWILQTGFPVIHVTRNYPENSAIVKQERFLLCQKYKEKTTWWIPISYITPKTFNVADTKVKVWMQQNQSEINISLPNNITVDDFLYINVKQAGYYRVNYDEENWRLLARHIDQFPPDMQAQLIDDSMNLARANLLDYEIPLNLIIESFRNPKYVSMATAFRNLHYIDQMLATTSIYGKFKLFMSQLTRSVYENLGFDELATDDYDRKMKRNEVLQWVCTFENSDCTTKARQQFRDWMNDDIDKKPETIQRTVTPNLKSVVYCTAIREGGEVEWNFAFKKYLITNSGTEKEVLLNAMGCASEPWLLSRYLDYALSNSSGIRKQDGSIVFTSVAKNVAGHLLSFDFIRTNWKKLNDHYGKAFSTISKMISSLPVFMNTPFELSQLEEFKNKNLNELGTSARAFDQSIEIVKYNVEWMDHSYKRIEEWLEETLRRYRLHPYNYHH